MPPTLRTKITKFNEVLSSPLVVGLYRIVVVVLCLFGAVFSYAGKKWVADKLDTLLAENPRIAAIPALELRSAANETSIGSIAQSVKELAVVTKSLQEAQAKQETASEALKLWAQTLSENHKLLQQQVNIQREHDIKRMDELAARLEKAIDRVNRIP